MAANTDSPASSHAQKPPPKLASEENLEKHTAMLSSSLSSSSSIPTSPENAIPTTSGLNTLHQPQQAVSTTTLTVRSPPPGGGGSSQIKRHSGVRSNSNPPIPTVSTVPSQQQQQSIVNVRQRSSSSLDRSTSSQPPATATHFIPTQQQTRPTSPIASPSIHKSLTVLDAKAITRDMEKSANMPLRTNTSTGSNTTAANSDIEPLMSPTSPTLPNTSAILSPQQQQQQQQQQPTLSSSFNNQFYAGGASSSGALVNNMSGFQTIASTTSIPTQSHFQYHRQNSVSSITLPNTATMPTHHLANSSQGDAWQTLCVRVLPLFNGEGVQGSIEDLNELLRRSLPDPITPKFYHDIEALLRDGMFTLNAKMFGVTDEKLLDRLVEQWSFFFTYALPYFEAVFLPLRTDVQYRSPDEAEMWNVRTMALKSFRDNVILLQTKRLEDVFNKLFTDFGSSQNPAATAAKMLQMTSLLASAPDQNEEIERVLSNLKANWKIMMTKGDRRGFAGVRKR